MDYLDEMTDLKDFDVLLEIKSQKDSIKWSGFDKGPDPILFKKYITENVINNPHNHLFLLKDGDTHEAMGYCQFVEEENNIFEGRGSGILKKFQGCGLAEVMGTLLLEKAKDLGCKYMYTWCAENNTPSINVLINAGWSKTNESKTCHLRAVDEDYIFFKWIKSL